MRWVATHRAFYGNRRLGVGDTFEAPETFKASWAVPDGEFVPPAEPSEEEQIARAVEGLKGKQETDDAPAGEPSQDEVPSVETKKKPRRKKKSAT